MIFKKGNVGPRKGSTACCLPTVKNPLLKDLASFAHLIVRVVWWKYIGKSSGLTMNVEKSLMIRFLRKEFIIR